MSSENIWTTTFLEYSTVHMLTYIIAPTNYEFFRGTGLKKIGISTSRHIAKKAIVRCIPIVGAVGVGAYAYYDTARVGKTVIELFSKTN